MPGPCGGAVAFWLELTHRLCLSASKRRVACLHQSGCQQVASGPKSFLCELLCVVSAYGYLAPTHIFRIPVEDVQILAWILDQSQTFSKESPSFHLLRYHIPFCLSRYTACSLVTFQLPGTPSPVPFPHSHLMN